MPTVTMAFFLGRKNCHRCPEIDDTRVASGQNGHSQELVVVIGSHEDGSCRTFCSCCVGNSNLAHNNSNIDTYNSNLAHEFSFLNSFIIYLE